MQKISLYLIIWILCIFKTTGTSVELVNIDFTRDSINWKTQLPIPAWNTTYTDYFAPFTNMQTGDYLFNDTWGRFNPGICTPQQSDNMG